MRRSRREPYRAAGTRVSAGLAVVALATLAMNVGGIAAETAFPYDTELSLDVRPMRGSKRVPMLEINRRGETAIEMWCNKVQAQIVVVENTITILTGPKTEESCAAERMRGDEDLLAALTAVTNWRRNGDVLTLTGPKTLRFRASTH
jgi:heat shock protein HslJ